jgi:hypothetical protein
MSNKNTIEARKHSEVVARITGERFCHSANHWTKAPTTLRKGRRICQPCQLRLSALQKKKSRSTNP